MSKDPKKNVKEEALPTEEIAEKELPAEKTEEEHPTKKTAEEHSAGENTEEGHTEEELPVEEISEEDAAGSSGEDERPKRKPIGTTRIVIAAIMMLFGVGVILIVYLMPMLQIGGFAMTPTLEYGEYVMIYKTTELKKGDIIAFNFNDRILVRRVLAHGGETFEIDKNGTVAINGRVQRENYIKMKAFGECDLEMPFTVPDGEYFVLGDDRVGSIDSRNTTVGCVSKEQIIGKVVFRIWPMNKLGRVE